MTVWLGMESMVYERLEGEPEATIPGANPASPDSGDDCRDAVTASAPVVGETVNPRAHDRVDLTIHFNVRNTAGRPCIVHYSFRRTTGFGDRVVEGEELVFGEGRVTEITRFLGSYAREDAERDLVPRISDLRVEGDAP